MILPIQGALPWIKGDAAFKHVRDDVRFHTFDRRIVPRLTSCQPVDLDDSKLFPDSDSSFAESK